MKLGDTANCRRPFSRENVAAWAALSGAEETGDVPEPLLGALLSYLLGVHLPGPGTNYLKQSLSFRAAARLDEPLTAGVEVTRLRREKYLVDLATTIRGEDGRLIAEGRALVRVQDVPGAFD